MVHICNPGLASSMLSESPCLKNLHAEREKDTGLHLVSTCTHTRKHVHTHTRTRMHTVVIEAGEKY